MVGMPVWSTSTDTSALLLVAGESGGEMSMRLLSFPIGVGRNVGSCEPSDTASGFAWLPDQSWADLEFFGPGPARTFVSGSMSYSAGKLRRLTGDLANYLAALSPHSKWKQSRKRTSTNRHDALGRSGKPPLRGNALKAGQHDRRWILGPGMAARWTAGLVGGGRWYPSCG